VTFRRLICVHGHFYQPPRENPFLEAVEIQDSARPYHDWNERLAAECYAPNSAARILDGEKRIVDIVNNYTKISFNFGPTLLSWMETKTPETYGAILEADRESVKARQGHGNAIAQVYNHVIMPLANTRDKRTQVIWGVKDFEHRFRRVPEGLWLPETAVDFETLDTVAEVGIRYVILAPHQASRVRSMKSRKWKNVKGSQIDPTRSYLCRLPSGRIIAIFFYDGPISRAVAFDKILSRGEDFAGRLLGGFSDKREWNQLLNIATDGETYGHHFKFGDMALAYALHHLESNGIGELINYGAYLETNPPAHEVEIIEDTSWSCFHGVERWKDNCGCNSGGHPDWNQEWRRPLREALDWLRDRLAEQYEREAATFLRNPWEARDGYIDVVLRRTEQTVEAFVSRYTRRSLEEADRRTLLKLLEIQRHAMLMYTSCGWFFDELSGIETVQILQYAGRAIQLSEELFGNGLEKGFLERLEKAKSNTAEHGDGRGIYEKFVKPAMVDLKRVAAHYAISSIFEEYGDATNIYGFSVKREDYQTLQAGVTKLAVGRVSVSSKVTGDSEEISFSVLALGGHALNGGVRGFLGDEAYASMKEGTIRAFEAGALTKILRLMDKHFGMHNYSLNDLFRDEQRHILRLIAREAVERFTVVFREMYEQNRVLMAFLREVNMPIPGPFLRVASATLNSEMEQAFSEDPVSYEKVRAVVDDMRKWNVDMEAIELEFTVRRRLEGMMDGFSREPSNISRLSEINQMIKILKLVPFDLNYWHVQNAYHRIVNSTYPGFVVARNSGDMRAGEWLHLFEELGDLLYFDIAGVRRIAEGACNGQG
jgi:alpha-amylase/alpha-mannosidase (GH57 family)